MVMDWTSMFLNEIYMSVYSVELYLYLVLLWIVYSTWRVVYNWYWLGMVVNNASCLMWWQSTTLCVWHGINDGSQRRRKVRRWSLNHYRVLESSPRWSLIVTSIPYQEGRRDKELNLYITECTNPHSDLPSLSAPSLTQREERQWCKVWTIKGCLNHQPDKPHSYCLLHLTPRGGEEMR